MTIEPIRKEPSQAWQSHRMTEEQLQAIEREIRAHGREKGKVIYLGSFSVQQVPGITPRHIMENFANVIPLAYDD